MDTHFKYWTEEDKKALNKAESFKDLAEIGLTVMNRMPKDVHVVSGPISTGGVGNLLENIEVFRGITEILRQEMGLNILSWVPFELKIRPLLAEWQKCNDKNSYCTPILDDFYHACFHSGKITKVHFIHGWESSFGSRWEHDLCEKLGIEINYLSPEFSHKALKRKSKYAN